MSDLIANARMYSVAPGATAAWKTLFAWLKARSGVEMTVIDHAFPASLDELWSREDLACTFMCGWPFMRYGAIHQVVAAPIPDAVYARGRPVYCSHFVVRDDAPFKTLEDTFGHRFAYTIPDSHSGYNAPRHHLLSYRKGSAKMLYREIVGPLRTPRLMVEAIVEGKTDVGPLDSFAYALLRRHWPEVAGRTRIIASTDVVPIPAFMASKGTPPEIVDRLAETLCTFGDDPEQAALRADLCLLGFARVAESDYQITERWAEAAEARGLGQIT
jgi:ABC-type phosphate/phosphonate transport system substrate-binding protein